MIKAKLCEQPDCGRPHRARGMCSTHYNQAHQPNRHRKIVVQCAQCGRHCQKDSGRERRYAALFCSMACRTEYTFSTEAGRAALDAAITAAALADHSWSPRRLAQATGGDRIWSSGPCRRCGEHFVAPGSEGMLAQFCSRACKLRTKTERHEHRKRGGQVEPYSRHAIFVRDGWRCHLCLKAIDPKLPFPDLMSATIDHLIPVVDGGADAPDNVRAAHMICNSRRQQYGAVQLMLIG